MSFWLDVYFVVYLMFELFVVLLGIWFSLVGWFKVGFCLLVFIVGYCFTLFVCLYFVCFVCFGFVVIVLWITFSLIVVFLRFL